MSVENYLSLLPLLLLAIFFFGVAISMFYWSAKKGQLKNFDQQAARLFLPMKNRKAKSPINSLQVKHPRIKPTLAIDKHSE